MEFDLEESLLGPLLLSRSTVNRSSALRADTTWLERVWRDPRTRVVPIENGRTLVRRNAGSTALVLLTPEQAPEGERYLLGVDDDGTAYYAVSAPLSPVDDAEPADLRQVGALLGDRDAGLLVYAVALEAWHATHEYCPRCGSRTEVGLEGHTRICPRDDSQHFPRIDPAVIMLIHDADDRCLLARGRGWPERRFSILAGFVEPGESLEQAVIREVAEEVGVAVTAPQYLGSQPWPFPRSLMLGFFARAVSTELNCDPAEIAEARWVSRADLKAQVGNGEIILPGELSIAHRLIERWYGERLP
ncbi:NAD(+) diphosphatase [Rhizohabitans arisaemae]|uniref:NAD(+) diphosphatase n=1 Tax=Rhizohabitans arisaemae TaxID=2720610 RepID=UPI0024B17C31|nr:NAD(+) diphosphatase [Rhizohabitans arisaemae]